MDIRNLEVKDYSSNPVRVLQFGEGNFLRAFADWMLDICNEQGRLNGSIVLVKPVRFGKLDTFNEQNNRYTVVLRGLRDGQRYEETRLVTSVSGTVGAYEEYERYAAYAKCETLRFVISNTTEAGIVLDENDKFEACPPETYPGKLTKFLFERAEYFNYAEDKGLIILPVELIDDNGGNLRRCVKALTKIWNLGEKFENWLDSCCVFTSTLVDRIVTGYPRGAGEAEELWAKLGYEDRLLDTAEPFGLWVIESPKDISEELPLPQCGLPVIFTDNQAPYKQRKVRILNGAHTSFVPASYQCGHDTVLESMEDDVIRTFMDGTLYEEVIPTLALPKDDLMSFASAVKERFGNPYIKHALLSICLNSVSKWRARCMPSLKKYIELRNALPRRLTFSLASLIAFYTSLEKAEYDVGGLYGTRSGESYRIMDDQKVLQFFSEHFGCTDIDALCRDVLSNETFWGEDLTQLPGLLAQVIADLKTIRKDGMNAAIAAVVQEG